MDFDRLAKSVEKEDKAKERESRGGGAYERQQKLIQPKNRAPAPRQITAEQLLRESIEYKEASLEPPTQHISNEKELSEYQLRKRKEFEDAIRRNRQAMGQWMRYAAFEASQKEWARARSVFERAIDIDYRNTAVWLKYIDFELANRFISHARNLFDRVITLLPRADQFWYKYVYMEEMLGDIPATRAIFQRWLTFHPEPRVYYSFIRFELRYKEYDKVRAIYQQFTIDHHHVDSYIKYAKFEEKYGSVTTARSIYELAMKELKESPKTENEKNEENEILLLAFALFEERQHEYERCRIIYQYTLNNIAKKKVPAIFDKYTQFEKKHGNKEQIETVILSKRRFLYEEEITANPYNYDVWFDYIHLECAMPSPNPTTVRGIYERALGYLPLELKKVYWKRYIYLWIYYAIYEEVENHEIEKSKEIYEKCLELLSTLPFKFSKLYILYAEFLIRQNNLSQARLIFGQAIVNVPKTNIFTAYIEIEYMLGEIDRCRKIYEKWLEVTGGNSADVWIQYAQMEEKLEEKERWRMLMELAIHQAMNTTASTIMDKPEKVWKFYIDAEIRQMILAKKQLATDTSTLPPNTLHELKQLSTGEKVRSLYIRLLELSKHVKVYISYAQFEASIKEWENTRKIFIKGDEYYRDKIIEIQEKISKIKSEIEHKDNQTEEELIQAFQSDLLLLKEERVLLLTSWYEYEKTYGTNTQQLLVKGKIPIQLKKRRVKQDNTGSNVIMYEEYIDYAFPDEKSENPARLKIMEKAKLWKLEQAKKKRKELEEGKRMLDQQEEKEEEKEKENAQGEVNIDDVMEEERTKEE